jgi:hypothetical protein
MILFLLSTFAENRLYCNENFNSILLYCHCMPQNNWENILSNLKYSLHQVEKNYHNFFFTEKKPFVSHKMGENSDRNIDPWSLNSPDY